MNADVATRRLTSAAYIARDIEVRSAMRSVAIQTPDTFLLVDSSGYVARMTGLATRVQYTRETGVTPLAAEPGVSCNQRAGVIYRIPFRRDRDRAPAQNAQKGYRKHSRPKPVGQNVRGRHPNGRLGLHPVRQSGQGGGRFGLSPFGAYRRNHNFSVVPR